VAIDYPGRIMSTEYCKRPSCNGEIEDDYCNVCGLAAAKSLSPSLTAQVHKSISATESCQRPSCQGQIEEGYCNVCGLAAAKSGTASLTSRTAQTAPTAASSPLTNRSSKGTRRTGSTANRSSRRQLGAGLVSIPELPSTEPEKLVLAEAVVPENKRFCASCNHQLRRESGFCSKCGQKFSFVPSLKPGDMVMNQYEVKGAIAYGGLGWVYLGYDVTLDRYVVLKGLLNSEDAASAAVAVAERKFLAAMKHPNVVGIYNFVNHGGEGFIIMEYVGGQSLKEIRKARGPLPPTEAVAYIHRVLSAFSYLHSQGLVYCDFKPDNMMLEGGDIKLIDMGGVRRLDDEDGDIYGTVGYTAPEIAEDGPTIASDLYTIGRTLAVLLANIPGLSKENQYKLPENEPVFVQQESLYRLLLRSTAQEPGDRFSSADEMADQLLGVLREMVAQETKIPRPASSTVFGGDALSIASGGSLDSIQPSERHLPAVILNPVDPAFQSLLGTISVPDLQQRVGLLTHLQQKFPESQEVPLQLANTLTELGQQDLALKLLTDLREKQGWDWRIAWYTGKIHLGTSDLVKAQESFEEVYNELPGELAPKIALGLTAERFGVEYLAEKRLEQGIKFYDRVSLTDPSYVTATFGLARCLALRGKRQEAVQALDRIPPSSSTYMRSQVEKARFLVSNKVKPPAAQDLKQASKVIEAATLADGEKHHLSCELFKSALTLLTTQAIKPDSSIELLGQSLGEIKLREGLEKSLRAMAYLAIGQEKINLVDEANRVRPRTLF
jgi:serine/threonine-protein kinase PknG